MKLILCFALSSVAFLVTNGKKIKIQIESEDLVNIFEGVMYSEVLQKFANSLAKRRQGKQPLKNPFHPEDELDNFNTDLDKDVEYDGQTKPDQESVTESLENQNEHFVNGNDVESGDILTDNDAKPKPKVIILKRDSEKNTSNSTRNSSDENNKLKKKIYDAVNNISMSAKKEKTYVKKKLKENRANLKQVQRRYILKGSNDTSTPYVKRKV